MSAYLRVLAATLTLALFMGVSIIFLNEQGATTFVTVEFLLIPLLDFLACLYIWRLVWTDQRRPRSWLLMLMATTSTMTTIGLAAIDFVLVRRLLGAEPLGLVLATDIYAIAIWLTGTVPIQKALVFYLVQLEREKTVDWPVERRAKP